MRDKYVPFIILLSIFVVSTVMILSGFPPSIKYVITKFGGDVDTGVNRTSEPSPASTGTAPTVDLASAHDELTAEFASAQAENEAALQEMAAVWQALPNDVRVRLLPDQRAWVRSKDATCRKEAAALTGDELDLSIARLSCDTSFQGERIGRLKKINVASDTRMPITNSGDYTQNQGSIYASPTAVPSRSDVAPQPPIPINAPASWVTTDDYPQKALREEREGITAFRVMVGPDGRVAACSTISSSGSFELDDATCQSVTQRARFKPALDSNGKPTSGSYSGRVRWSIPSD